jgi:hypothetical protein
MGSEEGLGSDARRGEGSPPRGRPSRGGSGEIVWPEGFEPYAEEEEPEKIAFFDLETEAWDRFVLGGLLSSSGLYEEFTDEEELFKALLAEGPGTSIYAWNGGRYDFLWFLEKAREQELTCQIGLAGTRITRIQVKEGPVFRDIVALVPMSLEKASSIAGIALTKDTGLVCSCGDDCGGYCRIRRAGMLPAERAALSVYLRRDVDTGMAIVRAVQAEAARCGYELRGTVGGTAYATARKVCGFDHAEWTPRSYELARSGYYGGRVEVFRPRAPEGWAYDINSAYPAALAETPIPTGERIIIAGDRASRAFHRGKEGIYEADVHVPAMFVPPLPARLGDRVLFPIGPVSGAWTRLELHAALEEGCTVRRWGRAIVWADAVKVCAPFMEKVWSHRAEAEAAGNAGLREWNKYVANSFTGKCAQQPEMESVILCPELIKLCSADECMFPDRVTCERRKRSPKCCLHACTRTCGAYRALDRKGKLWASSFYRLPDCGHVHWSAYLTAATRLKLRAQLIADGDGGRSAVYCDTDSVFATSERTWLIGDGLGEYGCMGPFKGFAAMAPKVYRYTGKKGSVAKAKGIPGMTADAWEAFSQGLPIRRDRGVKSLKTAAKAESLFTRTDLTRQSKADGRWFGGRHLSPDGCTYPVTIKEFERGT